MTPKNRAMIGRESVGERSASSTRPRGHEREVALPVEESGNDGSSRLMTASGAASNVSGAASDTSAASSDNNRVGRWKHGSVAVIGLTGGIGSGKSRVAAILGVRGAHVIDADAVGHQVLAEPDVIDRIEERFGAAVIGLVEGERRVDRRALGRIVFADARSRHELESIVHPVMRNRFEATIERAEAAGEASLIVLDAAILFEAGWALLCDKVIFVNAGAAVRLERVARTRGWTERELESREAAQWALPRKREAADWVINNESDEVALEHGIDRMEQWLREKTTWGSRQRAGVE